MLQILADKLAKSAKLDADLAIQSNPDLDAADYPFATVEDAFDAIRELGGLYEIEITVAQPHDGDIIRISPTFGPWKVVHYEMDLTIEDLAYDADDVNPWRWGLAEDGWDGTIEHAAQLIAEFQADIEPGETRPWRVRIWDIANGQDAEHWGRTIEQAIADQQAAEARDRNRGKTRRGRRGSGVTRALVTA